MGDTSRFASIYQGTDVVTKGAAVVRGNALYHVLERDALPGKTVGSPQSTLDAALDACNREARCTHVTGSQGGTAFTLKEYASGATSTSAAGKTYMRFDRMPTSNRIFGHAELDTPTAGITIDDKQIPDEWREYDRLRKAYCAWACRNTVSSDGKCHVVDVMDNTCIMKDILRDEDGNLKREKSSTAQGQGGYRGSLHVNHLINAMYQAREDPQANPCQSVDVQGAAESSVPWECLQDLGIHALVGQTLGSDTGLGTVLLKIGEDGLEEIDEGSVRVVNSRFLNAIKFLEESNQLFGHKKLFDLKPLVPPPRLVETTVRQQTTKLQWPVFTIAGVLICMAVICLLLSSRGV